MASIRRHREVIQFTCGLMRDPGPLVEFVFESCIGTNLRTMRTGHCEEFCVTIDQDLLQAMYRESRVDLPGRSNLSRLWIVETLSYSKVKYIKFQLFRHNVYNIYIDLSSILDKYCEQEIILKLGPKELFLFSNYMNKYFTRIFW